MADASRTNRPFETVCFATFTACGATHVANEDRFCAAGRLPAGGSLPATHALDYGSAPTPAVFAVFDGVGGAAHGDVAATAAATALKDGFAEALAGGSAPLQETLRRALAACEQAVAELHAFGPKAGFAACAGIALDDAGTGLVFHAGDVRAYRLRDPFAMRLTRDHSLAEEYRDEHGDDAVVPHDIAHVITRCLGERASGVVEVSEPRTVLANDIFLVCSDGLWEFVGPEDIEAAFLPMGDATTPENLADGLEALCRQAIARGAFDDITAVALSLAPVPPEPAGSEE